MPKKSDQTRLAIAGSCVSCELHARPSYNELRALQWATDKLNALAQAGVITVPPEHRNCFWPALDSLRHQMVTAELAARGEVAQIVKEGVEKGEVTR